MGHRGGSIDLAIPKLREGTYFPEWLLERRRRAIDVWGGERLQLDTPREFGRPLELTTRCCGQTRTVRGYPCSTCKEPFCPSCQRCRCDRRSQSEVTCWNCYLAYQAHLVVGGLCEECRS